MCGLSSQNKVTLSLAPGHSVIQGNEDADVMAQEFSRWFFISKPVFAASFLLVAHI
jgi:hypothetical protein